MIDMRKSCAALLMAAAAVSPAACSDLQTDFTTQDLPQNEGANADVGGVLLRNAFVIGGPASGKLRPGSDAPMYLALLNESGRPDRLVSVIAPGTFRGAVLPAGGLRIPPAGGYVGGTASPQVLLTGLVRPLASGTAIPVTLRFEHAGTARVHVPVLPPDGWRVTYSPWPSPSAMPAPSTAATGRSPRPRPAVPPVQRVGP